MTPLALALAPLAERLPLPWRCSLTGQAVPALSIEPEFLRCFFSFRYLLFFMRAEPFFRI
jgi:hypothetical protein